MADVFRPLLGRVKLEDGTTVVHRGEELPEDLAEGEADRLAELGAVGEPFKSEAEVVDEQIAEERAEFVAEVESAPAVGAPTAASPAEDIDAFVADATAKEVVDAGKADPELAPKLVEAEQTLRGDDARTSVLALTDES